MGCPSQPLYPEGDRVLKTLVVGLGNPILTDDGVGIHVVRAVASRVAGSSGSSSNGDLSFVEASVGGLRLLDLLNGYGRVILVDAIQTREGKPGDVYRLHAGNLHGSRHSGSTHDLTLSGALELGRRLGMELPSDSDVVILAVEVEDVLTFGEACTPQVEAAIPAVVEKVLLEIAACDLERVDR
jgi:hydrogenase maturation protease